VKNLENAKNAVVTSESANEASSNLPAPKPPFTDYRFEKPGNIRKITLNDLPTPFLTPSAGNSPKLVARPDGAWPQVPEGFHVELYAAGSMSRG
jgi:hypothetical protein